MTPEQRVPTSPERVPRRALALTWARDPEPAPRVFSVRGCSQPYLPGGEQHANFESTLGSAELFLAYMAQVPRLTPRLDAFHTKHTLPNRLADATAQVRVPRISSCHDWCGR